MALSSTTKVGFGLQSGGFQIVAASAMMAVPVDPPTFNLVYDVINDQTVRGDPVVDYNVYQGVKRVEASVDGPFFPEETGFFLKALMGSEVYTSSLGTTGTHVFTGFSQPSAATFFVTDDVVGSTNAQTYIGMLCSSFGIRFSAAEGILTFTSTWTGRDKPTGVISTTIPAFSTTLTPWLGWQAAVANTGGSASAWQGDVLDFEMTVNRAPSLLYTANNTQLAKRGDAGPMECTGRLSVDYNSLAQLTDYESNNEFQTTVTITNGLTNNSLRSLVIVLPKVHVLDSPQEIQRGGVSLAVQYGFRAVGNATDKAPVRWTLINARGGTNGAYNSL